MNKTRFLWVIFLVFIFALTSCILNDDVDNFYFQLPEKTYQIDAESLGISTTTEISCDPGDDHCPNINPALICDPDELFCKISEATTFPEIDCSNEDVCMEMGEAFYCDSRYNACSIEAPLQLNTSVHLAEEVEELKEVGNLKFSKVTLESLYFIVEINTLGVESPDLGLYIAENGILELSFDEQGEVITPGCQRIGSIPSVPASFTGQKDAVLTQAGREALSSYLKEPNTPFKLFVAGTVNLIPGAPFPNLDDGQFRVIISGTAVAKTDL